MYTLEKSANFNSSQARKFRDELSKLQKDLDSKKEFIMRLKNEYNLDDTVIDAKNRLAYSKLKDLERNQDIATLRKMLGLPEKLEYRMSEDCELHCIMSKTKVNWKIGIK